MKRLLLLMLMVSTLSVSAGRTPLLSWECNDLIVSFYEDDKMSVGELLYNVSYQGDNLVLYYGGRAMLLVKKGTNGSIVIINTDDRQDRKHFIKCK